MLNITRAIQRPIFIAVTPRVDGDAAGMARTSSCLLVRSPTTMSSLFLVFILPVSFLVIVCLMILTTSVKFFVLSLSPCLSVCMRVFCIGVFSFSFLLLQRHCRILRFISFSSRILVRSAVAGVVTRHSCWQLMNQNRRVPINSFSFRRFPKSGRRPLRGTTNNFIPMHHMTCWIREGTLLFMECRSLS